jgi:hypothetical protein
MLNLLPEFKISSLALAVNVFLPLMVTAPPDCVYCKIPAAFDGFLLI